MSTGPARLSRRSLLRGAASVTVLAAFAAISSCADGQPRASDPGGSGEGSPLLRLGHSVVDDGRVPRSGSSTSVPAIATDAAAVRAIDERSAEVRADFAAGATVVAAGWLVATTEADVLADYAGACPLPAC